MKYFVKVSSENQTQNMIQMIYENQQPEQLPQIEINDDYVDYFKKRFFEFYLVDGKLIESKHQDFENYKLKSIIKSQQLMLSNATQSQAKTQMQFNSAVQMNGKFMEQLANLQMQVKKLQEAK